MQNKDFDPKKYLLVDAKSIKDYILLFRTNLKSFIIIFSIIFIVSLAMPFTHQIYINQLLL